MSKIFSIRLSSDERAILQEKAVKLGYKSESELAKKLIQQGLKNIEFRQTDEHVLFNSAQSVMLLREIIGLLTGNEGQSAQVIKEAKTSAEEWTNRYKETIGA